MVLVKTQQKNKGIFGQINVKKSERKIMEIENIKLKKEGDLTNVAPTLLKYMDIALPKGMEESKDLFYEE